MSNLIDTAGQEGHTLEVAPIANPYVIGSSVSGQLYIEREDILCRFEELWSRPGQLPSIVLYGHRRTGKTSILRNLPVRFSSDRVIDFNMQRVGHVNSTGELLHRLALEIYDTLSPDQQATLPEPSDTDFSAKNPTTSFDRFLKKLAPLLNGQRLIIVIDEFELIEERINAGQLDPSLLDYWRALIQTYPWFVLVFAGLHTLREMTDDYWNPLFGSVTAIPVSFLSPKAATQLITNPTPDFSIDYDPDAVERIIQLTNGQPYLTQHLCHTLVTRYNRLRFEEGGNQAPRFSRQDVEAIIAMPEFYRDGNAYFRGVWAQAEETHGAIQLHILRALSHGPLTIPALCQHTNLALDQIQAALHTLEEHDVIDRQDDHYVYKVELMRCWVAFQQFPSGSPSII